MSRSSTMNFDSKVLRLSAMLVTACILACPAVAQEQAVVTIPPNIVVPNYDSVATGPYGGLEGGAYVARTSDPSAAWFNPAGLSRSTGSQTVSYTHLRAHETPEHL